MLHSVVESDEAEQEAGEQAVYCVRFKVVGCGFYYLRVSCEYIRDQIAMEEQQIIAPKCL